MSALFRVGTVRLSVEVGAGRHIEESLFRVLMSALVKECFSHGEDGPRLGAGWQGG